MALEIPAENASRSAPQSAHQPCIISVAITGSVPRKKDNPALPVTIAEQVESTREAYEAGAALVHVHVRDEQENPSSDPERFARLQEGIRAACPDIIIQFSTGGRGRALDQRGSMLHLRPDMASLATGSVNFPTIVYENPPDFIRSLAVTMRDSGIKPEIEVFDLAMLYNTADLVAAGLITPPPHVQFVFGVKHALPARQEILEFEIAQLEKLLPGATWTAAGIGRHQLEVNHWALELGGHCRTGLEDNIRWDKTTLAPGNAALVRRVAELCGQYERPVATPAEARRMLGLRN
ncbi:MAG TPA: 3-keto-5-aminohexanoate cleavage protein [Acetobacteraceae bacterium]|nr:3-keto-5-aminohexanoate cleavage protein [Acetobacteraceae bacterium]